MKLPSCVFKTVWLCSLTIRKTNRQHLYQNPSGVYSFTVDIWVSYSSKTVQSLAALPSANNSDALHTLESITFVSQIDSFFNNRYWKLDYCVRYCQIMTIYTVGKFYQKVLLTIWVRSPGRNHRFSSSSSFVLRRNWSIAQESRSANRTLVSSLISTNTDVDSFARPWEHSS